MFERTQTPYVILERSPSAGSFFSTYPRHRKLLSINKRYTGCAEPSSRMRYDWNSLLCDDEALRFTRYSEDYFPNASALVKYLGDFADHHQLKINFDTAVDKVERSHREFNVSTTDGRRFVCERLFVATGVPEVRRPTFPGVELCEGYDVLSTDPRDYTDQRVFILGKGNSAFETADSLIETTRKIWICGPKPIRLAWTTHYVGDLRAVNNDYLDTYQLKAQNNILDGEVRAVRRVEGRDELEVEVYFESRQRSYDFRCDRVLLCTGFRFDRSIFADNCKPDLRPCGNLPQMTCEWESTNVEYMFFVGTLMQSRDHRKTMSGFIHGFRHNITALVEMLACRDGHLAFPGLKAVAPCARELADMLIARMSTSAEIMLQPGFLADAVLLGSEQQGHELCYLSGVPVDYLRERVFPTTASALMLTLEYKEPSRHLDVFNMPRGLGVAEDFYLHPVLRLYRGGTEAERFFLPDDLDNDWSKDETYVHRLRQWLEESVFAAPGGSEYGVSYVHELAPAPEGASNVGRP